MRKITIDIETVPCENGSIEYCILTEKMNKKIENLKAPSNYGDEASAKWLAKKTVELEQGLEEERIRTSLDGKLGKILMIGFAIDDEEPVILSTDAFDERDLLIEFGNVIINNFTKPSGQWEEFKIVGYNCLDFDLRFLYQRAVIHGVMDNLGLRQTLKPSYKFGEVDDVMKMFCGYKDRISMANLCKIMGIGGKFDGMDGSMVYDLYKKSAWSALMSYCKDDVEKTRELHSNL